MSFGFGIGDFIAAFKLAGKLRQQWLDAPGEYATARNEIKNVETILRDLNDLSSRIEITQLHKKSLTAISSCCLEVLGQADTIVSKYSASPSSGRVRRIWKRFRADPDDIRHVRDQLASIVTQLSACQNNIEINLIKEINDDLKDLYLSHNEAKKLKIAEWFAPLSFAEQQNDQLARRQPGTGNWFLQNSRYLRWRDCSSGTLFCPGIPGSGKSVIVATVVDDLRTYFDRDRTVLVAYFYCNYRRQDEQSLWHILAALIRQLFQEQPQLPQIILDIYQKHFDRGSRPSTDDLFELTCALIKMYSKVFILIDALDELSDEDRTRSRLISCLFELQNQDDSSVNLLHTCRPGIVSQFDAVSQIEIRAQQQDVERYISAHIMELAPCVQKNLQIQAEIVQCILSAVDGMFLLARLHLQSLKDKTNIRELRQALRRLPRGSKALSLAYDEAFARIDSQLAGFRELARMALTWISYARAELTMQELLEALAIRPGVADIGAETDLDDEQTVVSVCAGLVVVDQSSDIVRLVHHTTQKYLESIRQHWIPEGEVSIARSCIAYLSMKVFYTNGIRWGLDLEPILQRYKLLAYISQHWGFHCNGHDILGHYSHWLNPNSEALCFIGQLAFIDPSGKHGTHTCEYEDIQILHLYARFDNHIAIKSLPEHDDAINCINNHGETPLHIAASRGFHQTVAQLIDRANIKVNLQDRYSRTALHIASWFGHKETIAALLTRSEIDINIQNDQGRTPLFISICQGHIDTVVTLLTRSDIDVNAQDEDGRTALYAASNLGNSLSVSLLLERPDVDINLQNIFGMTPLHIAILSGHDDVVSTLLTSSVIDVNLRDDEGRTPLYAATVLNDDTTVIALLTKPDIDVNAPKEHGWTPLHAASYYGHDQVASTLLSRSDTNVNLPDKYGQRPLLAACHRRQEMIVTALLARSDIDVNVTNQHGHTSLFIASGQGYVEIVAALLTSSEIDVNLPDRHGFTPLYAACSRGHSQVVAVLLERPEIDFNSLLYDGDSELGVAERNGHDQIVAQLLAHLDIHSDDCAGSAVYGRSLNKTLQREKAQLETESSLEKAVRRCSW